MFCSIDLRGSKAVPFISFRQLLGKTRSCSASIALGIIVLAGCSAQGPVEQAVPKPDKQSKVSIDSFRVVNAGPDSVEIELAGSNDGSQGQLCLGASAKSRDGIVRSPGFTPYVLPLGHPFHIPVKVTRPSGTGQLHTDALAVKVYPCGKDVMLSRIFDWPYDWPARAEDHSGGEASGNAGPVADYPWQIFFQDMSELDFASLDMLIERWNNPSERDRNGEWKLNGFSDALNYFTQISDWHGNLERIRKWRNFNPKSPGAAIAEAKYWVAYGWYIRGYEYNTDVDPVAIKVFHQRMQRAEQILRESRGYAANNPLWYETYLEISVDDRRDDKFTAQMFDEGVRKYPYFQPLYVEMAKRWSPWSGENADWQKVDDLVNLAAEQTKPLDGNIDYALLYAKINDGQKIEFNLFQDSLASWPRMRDAFEQWVKRYPSDDNFNEFAAYACRAGDKEAYLGVRPKIQGHIVKGKWPSNYSIDLCDHSFMQYSRASGRLDAGAT
jgi:hypothetical protein